MPTKIIQKEKDRQEDYLEEPTEGLYNIGRIYSHRKSLINLKEHFEDMLKKIIPEEYIFASNAIKISSILEEDIKELNKMIGAYK
jgi:vacuolar-type H+-ATPase subunit I/STV1